MPYDPSHAISFDFGRGSVTVEGGGARVVLPAEAVQALSAAASLEAARDFGRRLGIEMGRRVAARLGNVDRATIDDVVEHLGADLALSGLGSMGVERWGRALVVTVQGSPLSGPGDDLLAAIFEGALQRLHSRDAAVVPLHRDGDGVRLLVVAPGVAERVRAWKASGASWGDVLGRLHGGAA